MSRRAVLAAALGLGGLAVAVGLLGREVGPFAAPGARAVLADATAAQIDTVDVRGRVVEASVDGVVTQVDADDAVWLTVGADAVPLRFAEAAGLAVEDRVLATGRVRARGGRRWLAVGSWVRVEASVETQIGPDSLLAAPTGAVR